MHHLLTLALFIFSLPMLSAAPTELAAVTFTIDFPTSQPEHYSLKIQADGSARYESSGRLSADSDATDSFELDFSVSPEMRQKIFELAAKANYFQKDVDSHHKNLANTGKKTLTYKDSQRHGESTFNYSPNPAVQSLTNSFQTLSATLECGHRLQYDRQYQKLALDEELKRMENLVKRDELPEIQAIRPILEQIVADASVVNVSRGRAERLLAGLQAR